MDADTAEAFEKVNEKLLAHDDRFDRLEARFDRLEGRFDRLEGRFDKAEGESEDLHLMLIEEFRRIDRRFIEQEHKLEHKMEERLAHYFGLIKEEFDDRFRQLQEFLVPEKPWKEAWEARVKMLAGQSANHETRIQTLEKNR